MTKEINLNVRALLLAEENGWVEESYNRFVKTVVENEREVVYASNRKQLISKYLKRVRRELDEV